ncbi:MAG: hypothetical protein KF687_13235 [Cyclobacteriaceae bacterium]|nr:hypothetical protein [Cyclobacteriaceae bacterium]
MLRLCVIIFIALGYQVLAQRDTVLLSPAERDTVLLKNYAQRYNPQKALLYAAVVPGLGQVYTKKYWKLPLVYGGIGATGYAINFYQQGYQEFRGQLFYNLENGLRNEGDVNPNTGYTTAQLRTITDRYRRERDFMLIVMLGVYVLQMIDAHVDAHLREFDLNPQLRVRLEPSFNDDMLLGRTGGLSLKIKF